VASGSDLMPVHGPDSVRRCVVPGSGIRPAGCGREWRPCGTTWIRPSVHRAGHSGLRGWSTRRGRSTAHRSAGREPGGSDRWAFRTASRWRCS